MVTKNHLVGAFLKLCRMKNSGNLVEAYPESSHMVNSDTVIFSQSIYIQP